MFQVTFSVGGSDEGWDYETLDEAVAAIAAFARDALSQPEGDFAIHLSTGDD